MKAVACVFLILFNDVLSGSGGKEHVHFKIHVPELIKHQVHTKTVFIHVHKTVPKKKKAPEEEHHHHHEDWSSWSNYEHHEDDGEKYGYKHQGGHEDHEDQKFPKDDHEDSYKPGQPSAKDAQEPRNPGDFTGYSYPPQLAPVKEISDNDIESFEEGYRKGHRSETGGRYSDLFSKFHDTRHEEAEELDHGYGDDSHKKTNAGRYFVTEDDVDRISGKFHPDKHPISARIFLAK